MRTIRRLFLPLLPLFVLLPSIAGAQVVRQVQFPLRGKVLDLNVYLPKGTPKGTVLVGSGDVGWVGLGVEVAEFLQVQGYCAVGINVRQYLAVFTSPKGTMTTSDPQSDYAALMGFLRQRGTLWEPVIVSGLSEGAALAVQAASAAQNHAWLRGVITMGLPPTAEIGWRWADFTSWITKRDPNEPMFAPKDFIAAVAPVPLFMVQSTIDEYVTEADYRLFERLAQEPKRLVLIRASNHRFTDRKKELKDTLLAGLGWIAEMGGKR
jgi:alpha/beta superfamily hydrolase